MKFDFIEVSIQKIKINDNFFRISTKFDVEDLVKSIKSIGLLSHPYLIEKDNFYRIISGFRRIRACNLLGYNNIIGKVLCKKTSKAQCANIAIAENTFHRKLNIIEKSRCYHLLKITDYNLDFNNNLNDLIGLEANKTAFNKIESLCSLSFNIQNALLKEYISLPLAIKLINMKEIDANLFIDLFKKIKTSLSNQREIMDLIIEISLSENIAIKSILNEKSIKKIFYDNLNSPQKTNQLKIYLKKRRYPIITSTINKFNKNLNILNLHENIKMKPPKFFENTSYNLNIKFDTPNELKEYKKELDKIINNPFIFNSF